MLIVGFGERRLFGSDAGAAKLDAPAMRLFLCEIVRLKIDLAIDNATYELTMVRDC